MKKMKRRHLIFGVITGLLLLFSSYAFATDQDKYEPNNTFEQATKITLGQVVTSTIAPKRDIDYFKINIPKRGLFTAKLTEVPKAINPWFGLYNSQKQYLRTYSRGSGKSITIQMELLQGGDYYLRIYDPRNNVQTPEPYKITTELISPDATPPISIITSPKSNSIISGTITIVGTAIDENFLNYGVQYGTGSLPNIWFTMATSTTQVANGTLATWDTSLLPDATYTIRLEVKDKSNNIATDTVKVNIDNTPPVARIIFPANNSTIPQGTITIRGTANDEYLLNWILEYGIGEIPQTYTLIASSTTKVISGTLGSIYLPTGSYTLKLIVKDRTNKIATHSLSFIITESLSTPEQILSKVAENFAKIEDMKAKAITRVSIGTETSGEIERSILMKKPDKCKVINPVKDVIIIMNGEKMYVIEKEEGVKEVEEIDIGEISITSPFGLNYYYHLNEVKKVNEIKIKEYQGDIYVVEISPKELTWPYVKMIVSIDYEKGIELKNETYYGEWDEDKEKFMFKNDPHIILEYKDYQLIESTYIPMKVEQKILLGDEVVYYITRYDDIRLNTGIPDSEFEP